MFFKTIAFLLAINVQYSTESYSVKHFPQKVDHFGVQITNGIESLYRQRYIVIDDFCPYPVELQKLGRPPSKEDIERLDPRNHTIFFYTGGHGSIEEFYNSSGFVLDLAEYYGALVVFAEHRFYGESFPFGGDSFFDQSNLFYLTVDQAVADYANLIFEVKFDQVMLDAKVITFGVGYAGSLAAYMRFKYQPLVSGALASGAPLQMPTNFTSRTLFWEHVTKVYEEVPQIGPEVKLRIRRAFKEIYELHIYGPQGYTSITKKFHLCNPLNEDNYDQLLYSIRNVFAQMALHNYPYDVDEYPKMSVYYTAAIVHYAPTDVQGLVDLVYWYYGIEEHDCFDPNEVFQLCADPTGCLNGTDGVAWAFQNCWELNTVIGSDEASGMFPNLPWTDEDRTAHCDKTFDLPTSQRHQWFGVSYWGSHTSSASNIIYTNGLLDPFYGTGLIDTSTSDLAKVGSMENAGHGLDLRAPVEGDGMEEYREIELELIGQIIDGTFPAS